MGPGINILILMTTPKPNRHQLLTSAKIDAAIAELEYRVTDKFSRRDIRSPFAHSKGMQRMSQATRSSIAKGYREDLRAQVSALRSLRLVKAMRDMGI